MTISASDESKGCDMWNDAILAYFKVLPQHLFPKTGKDKISARIVGVWEDKSTWVY
jgi:hypothetical protein